MEVWCIVWRFGGQYGALVDSKEVCFVGHYETLVDSMGV